MSEEDSGREKRRGYRGKAAMSPRVKREKRHELP